jgi:hypothetical protein
MCGARWPLLEVWQANQVPELTRFPVVLGFRGCACARLCGMHVAVVLWAKALPDLVGSGDGDAHGRRFPPWWHRQGAPLHSIPFV